MNTLSHVEEKNLDDLHRIPKERCFEKLYSKKKKNPYFRVSVISTLFLKITFWIIDGRK